MAVTDVVYLSHNRREFVEQTFPMMLANTDWDHVRRLCIYDDESTDGANEYLRVAMRDTPVPVSFVEHALGSPVGVMNSYLKDYSPDSDYWAKLDSDIIVAAGWLPRLLEVMGTNADLEALGMEPGRAQHALPFEADRGWMSCSHIGGVGLLRTAAFRSRTGIPERGRFGWTEFQHRQGVVSGWVVPDAGVFALDLLPLEPWASLTDRYIEKGWARRWPKYDERSSSGLWEWWLPAMEAA